MSAIHVLYVDDDPILARLMQRTLGRRGFVIDHAATAAEGLSKAAEGRFDCMILDHDLGGATGLDVLGALQDAKLNLPAIYVTASSEVSIAVEALKAGAVDFVLKAVGDNFDLMLESAIRQALAQARLQQEKEKTEAELREAHDRAVALLSEVNHRVANSLALVASLVRMQAGAVSDQGAKNALAETQIRIAAIADLHRSLYTSSDVRSVDLAAYLGGLIVNLEASVLDRSHGAMIVPELATVQATTDKAVSVGMIVSELVTNAVKYAYPHGGGEVRVRLWPNDDGKVALSVEDDGVGWSGQGKPQGTGLGSKIVVAMARSLGSELVYDRRSRGTRAGLVFDP